LKEGVLLRSDKYISINPYTGNLIREFPYWDDKQIDQSIRSSKQAYHFWSHTTIEERKSFLAALSEFLKVKADDWAVIITEEMGKPLSQSKAEILKSATLCDYYYQQLEVLSQPRMIPLDNKRYGMVKPQAQGAVLGMMPWNFPIWQAIRFAVPVISGGNVVLLKHAQNVGITANLIEEAITHAAGLEGVLINTFITHDDIARYLQDEHIVGASLTGSERAGVAVGRIAGINIKKTVMELGGSDVFIVLEDADLELSAEIAVKARLNNNGQTCIAAKRFYIHKNIYPKWKESFVEIIKSKKIGDPKDHSNELSGLARNDLAETLQAQVDKTVSMGARKLLSGGVDKDNPSIYHPEIIEHIDSKSPLSCEETFGPVAALFPFEDEQEMLSRVNASRYGLGASVWSTDTDHAIAIADQVNAGSVAVNQMMSSDPRLPFGGIKKSGFGREMSMEGFLEFLNLKTIIVSNE
jgi:succinate-semialdehyde dehydrogenase/glutarate-semialdehyde dehydrogenase